MQVKNHLLDEVGNVTVFWPTDIHSPVMGESLGTWGFLHSGSMSEFYFHLNSTVLKNIQHVCMIEIIYSQI